MAHIGQENYYSLSGKPLCELVKKVYPFNVATKLRPDPVETVERQTPPVQGDHVKALPYWSRLHKSAAYGDGIVEYVAQWNNTALVGNVIPPQTCSAQQQLGSLTVGNFDVWGYTAAPEVLAVPTGTAAQWQFCEHMANTKARANLNKGLINVPLLIAERKETAELIGTNVKRMAATIRDVATRDLSRIRKLKKQADKRRVARGIANEHLAIIFGMLPLIDEVEGAVELLERPVLDFIRSRGLFNMVLSETSIDTTSAVTAPSNISLMNSAGRVATVTSKGVSRKTISVRTALRYKLSSQLAQTGRHLGFEPVGAAFDLIPLSFIVGWFSNLDDYIRALAPIVGAEFETGSRNRRQKHMIDFSVTVHPSAPGSLYGNPTRFVIPPQLKEPNMYIAEKRHDTRFVLTEPPETNLHWDVDVGLAEIAAGLSLTVQRYVKPLKRLAKAKEFRYKARKPKWLKALTYIPPKDIKNAQNTRSFR